mmetsp:Transcript_68202/g.181520  ORF Transcript_68202/g.181520 Transcript_68202/m.181520 type:complete len:245 (+) Transcript_68202:343-1077(+)
MTEGKVRNHDVVVVQSSLARATHQGLNGPRDVIVGDHDRLGRTGRSASVDQSARLPCLPRVRTGFQIRIGDIFAKVKKPFKGVNRNGTLGLDVLRNSIGSVHDQSRQIGQILADFVVLFELLDAFTDDDLGLRMLGYVRARFRVVGRVDTGRDSSRRDSTKVRKEPFGSVKSNNIDRVETGKAYFEQSFTKTVDLLTIFLPAILRPSDIRHVLALLGAFVVQGCAVSILRHLRIKVLHDGFGRE